MTDWPTHYTPDTTVEPVTAEEALEAMRESLDVSACDSLEKLARRGFVIARRKA